MKKGDGDMYADQYRHISARLMRLDELNLSIQKVSGYTVEQLFQMFLSGYELKPPEYQSVENISKVVGVKVMNELSVFQRAIATWGEDAQMKMVLEEMSELQKEICKLWRGKDNRDAIAEEVADVEIMLGQLKVMLDIGGDVGHHKTTKLLRLQKRLEGQG